VSKNGCTGLIVPAVDACKGCDTEGSNGLVAAGEAHLTKGGERRGDKATACGTGAHRQPGCRGLAAGTRGYDAVGEALRVQEE